MRKFATVILLPTKFVTRTLSVRISLMIVSAIATLLTVALLIMFHFSRKVVKKEARQKAEQTLESTVRQVDNVLLSVEQSSGNIYFDMINHLNQPERMFTYSRKIVETNPYVAGCAIAYEPYYYKDHGQYFMAYVHHASADSLQMSDSPIIQAETFGNVPYTEQIWYTQPMETGHPCWLNPLKDNQTEGEAIITFCLPIYSAERRPVGVFAVDVSLPLLSQIVLSAKPSPNSYATLLGSDGSYIVHPDSTKLFHRSIMDYKDDHELIEVGKAMIAGETGYKHFKVAGVDSYVFYKPFKRAEVPGRSLDDAGWSIGIVYPEADIFGEYNELLYIVIGIAIAGLLFLLVGCWAIAHHQLLPLRMLSKSAQRIAEGHYDEPIPDSQQEDEVGRLQDHFQQMQQALSAHVGELKRLTEDLRSQGEVLTEAYEQVRESDRVKTAFLHNMTNQMTVPVSAIETDVATLCAHCQEMDSQDANQVVAHIEEQGKVVTVLLNELLDASLKEVKE
ncbi:MAG: HAMP domain-containing protein [Prevotella sp.]|nr:HAMP domain-containing protein [Prevotella sp.]